jgi:hypothetical protein
MRKTARDQYIDALNDALDELAALRRLFDQSGDLAPARDGLRTWRTRTEKVIETYGGREEAKLFVRHVDLDVRGMSGSLVVGCFDAYESLIHSALERLPSTDVRGGYADELRVPLEQIDELLDWLTDSFKRSMHSGELDYQTAEEGLRRWTDRAYAILTEIVGEEEAGQLYHMKPANASWGNVDGTIEEQYEMYIKYLHNLKDDIQKHPHHLTGSTALRQSDATGAYVDSARLRELRDIRSSKFDLARLIALCDELNITWRAGANHATGMLVRAIMDHVPPIFGVSAFAQIASNYAGSRSFKEAMTALETAARKISDAHLHTQIRALTYLTQTLSVASL